MSRLGKLGRDATFYFGIGGAASDASAVREQASWVPVLLRVAPPLLALSIVRLVLRLDDDFGGLMAQLGLVVVLAVLWSGVLLMIGRRRGIRRYVD
jgi:hypothetical protein